jgi:hypothetical protein
MHINDHKYLLKIKSLSVFTIAHEDKLVMLSNDFFFLEIHNNNLTFLNEKKYNTTKKTFLA